VELVTDILPNVAAALCHYHTAVQRHRATRILRCMPVMARLLVKTEIFALAVYFCGIYDAFQNPDVRVVYGGYSSW
jgi:hypothetical protein